MSDPHHPQRAFQGSYLDCLSVFSPLGRLATAAGPRAIADLRAGDALLTRDHGYVPLLMAMPLAGAHPGVIIGPDAMGPGMPMRQITVSGAVRLWNLRFQQGGELARADDLRSLNHVNAVAARPMVALICDRAVGVLIDGAWVECPGPSARLVAALLPHLGDEDRARLVATFSNRPLPERAPADVPPQSLHRATDLPAPRHRALH
ncbi:Hint domain-containing protein [Paracoccus sp. p4-l81]|uniref:Hint domain-containing protein n=1 Tax=unclassified Paracoccus (in: a-proteobacteria) TaxID=2688777 RepID=UPI0035B713E7